jgi:hypothetical protein
MNSHDSELSKEFERLFNLGLAPQWLRPKSKAPIKKDWTKLPRGKLSDLLAEYQPGFGLGLRLGSVSQKLVVFDIDIRTNLQRHKKEALDVIKEIDPTLLTDDPLVFTGRGNKSCHIYTTSDDLQSRNLGRSKELVVVYSPTSDLSKAQLHFVETGLITTEQLKGGFRVKAAWEVDYMANGKQVVVPPTLHPDTEKAYRWLRPIT